MSVYKKKGSPYYHYDFQAFGRRYHGTTGLETKAEAKGFEKQKRKEAAAQAASGQRPPMTLNTATTQFWAEVSQWEKTADTQLYQLENLCRIIGKTKYLDQISDPELANFVSRRRAEEVRSRRKDKAPTGRLIGNASVNREWELLRRVMRRAKRVWKVAVGEMPDWRAHRLPEAKGRVRELAAGEESVLFQHLREDFHPLFLFAMLTGGRLAAGIGLEWSRVDFQAGGFYILLKTNRPEPEWHWVPMTGPLRALIATQRGNHPQFVFTYVCRKTRAARRKGERYPFTANGWRKDFDRAKEAAGIENFRFHDFRHTAATRTLRTCQNLKIVQQMLGHASITSTARYAHVLDEDLREAMEATHSRNSPEAVPEGDRKPLKKSG